MKHQRSFFSAFLFILFWSLAACGGGTSTIDNPQSPSNSSANNNQSTSDNSSDINLPAGILEVTLPDGADVRISIKACHGNDTMLDIQEHTKNASEDNPYVDIVITYPKGEGETDDGQFFINYGQSPSEPNSLWGGGTQSARMWRGDDQSGRFTNVNLDGRNFSAQWKCP